MNGLGDARSSAPPRCGSHDAVANWRKPEARNAALQVCCMGKSPEQRGGVSLEGAELLTFEIANPRARQNWYSVFRKIFNTVGMMR